MGAKYSNPMMFSFIFLRKTSLSINQDSGFEVSVSSATKFFIDEKELNESDIDEHSNRFYYN